MMDIDLIDPEIARLIAQEQRRQEEVIELIASENYASEAVLQAQGSVLTNKYAEGYPGKRYYGGCQYVDEVEQLAIDRAKELFQADYANVQPHSGCQANAAALMALLDPGDCLLGMDLAHGGHLSHGSRVNFSGKLYRAYTYGVDLKTHLIDYQQLSDQAKKYQPKVIIAGFSAYSRVLDWQKFREIADEVGAYLMADIAHVAGLIAADLYPSPIPWADVVTSTTHKTLRGPRGGLILARANLAKKINSAVFPGSQGGPLMHVIAAKAVCFKEALQSEFKSYQQSVIHHAKTMAKIVHERGYAVLTGGTDNHLFLISLINKQCTGAQAEKNLEQANITVNKNMIPNDPQPPMVTSGLRIGTPAVTTRGIKTEQLTTLTHYICDILDDPHPDKIEQVKQWVLQVCRAFPVYSDRV